ncbi:DUF3990 domain-containing protein [Agrobacterium rubi]|nr:DUF3990 domain-containing protein [Agrobacterium rubi]NTF24093.1 DUF3990 domain-containing protein [Agrobacterium rubi]
MDYVLAHGSAADFDTFDLSFCRRTSMGRGFYFTSSFEMAQVYSGGRDPIVARVQLDNPYEIDALLVPSEDVMAWARIFRMADAREQLIGSGYDGVIFREGDFIEAVAFHPEQIESLGRQPSFAASEGQGGPVLS